MELNIKKVQFGNRNELLGNKKPEDVSLEYYCQSGEDGLGGLVEGSIGCQEFRRIAERNIDKFNSIENDLIPYRENMKIPVAISIPLGELRLDKALNIISFCMAGADLKTFVDDTENHSQRCEQYRHEYYDLSIYMHVSPGFWMGGIPNYTGEYVTFDNFFTPGIEENGEESVFCSSLKPELANMAGITISVRILHYNASDCSEEYFKTQGKVDEINVNDFFNDNAGLKKEVELLLEHNLRNKDTLYVNSGLIAEQYITEVDLLALDVIKLVKKGTDSIENPTGDFLGLSVEALVNYKSDMFRVGGTDTHFLPYIVKGDKSVLHTITGIDYIKCICLATYMKNGFGIDIIDKNYISILVPKGKLLDMKTKYVENIKSKKHNIDDLFDTGGISENKNMFSGFSAWPLGLM